MFHVNDYASICRVKVYESFRFAEKGKRGRKKGKQQSTVSSSGRTPPREEEHSIAEADASSQSSFDMKRIWFFEIYFSDIGIRRFSFEDWLIKGELFVDDMLFNLKGSTCLEKKLRVV